MRGERSEFRAERNKNSRRVPLIYTEKFGRGMRALLAVESSPHGQGGPTMYSWVFKCIPKIFGKKNRYIYYIVHIGIKKIKRKLKLLILGLVSPFLLYWA